MLVLSRQKDESIIIGENITITVVEVRGDRVRLGIEAPREVSVHRREVYDAILREKGKITSNAKPIGISEVGEGSGIPSASYVPSVGPAPPTPMPETLAKPASP